MNGEPKAPAGTREMQVYASETPHETPYEAVMERWERIPSDWLRRFTPIEWIRAALRELRAAEAAYKQQNALAGLAGCRRAAGMALNAVVILEPSEAWKRSYVDHLRALVEEARAPAAVRDAAKRLLEAPGPSGSLVALRSPSSDDRVLEAARDVMAHAYAVVARHGADLDEDPTRDEPSAEDAGEGGER